MADVRKTVETTKKERDSALAELAGLEADLKNAQMSEALEDGLKSILLAEGADSEGAVRDARAISGKVLNNLGISRPTSISSMMSTRSGAVVVEDSRLWGSVAKAKRDKAAQIAAQDFQGEWEKSLKAPEDWQPERCRHASCVQGISGETVCKFEDN